MRFLVGLSVVLYGGVMFLWGMHVGAEGVRCQLPKELGPTKSWIWAGDGR